MGHIPPPYFPLTPEGQREYLRWIAARQRERFWQAMMLLAGVLCMLLIASARVVRYIWEHSQ